MVSIVSFRAECQHDWEDLKVELEKAGIKYDISAPIAFDMGEVHVELTITGGATINDVWDCAENVIDGHILRDTLRACALKDNSLERRYNDIDKPRNWLD